MESCPFGLPPSRTALRLPTTEHVLRCRERKPHITRSLSECMNLAPAGSGSQSLFEALQTADKKGLWHHSHARACRRTRPPGARQP